MIINSILIYVDPGSGSYLIQVIIAAVLGALFYVKNLWWQIKSFFTRSTKEEPPKNNTPDE